MLKKIYRYLLINNHTIDCLVVIYCLWSIFCYCFNNIESGRVFSWGLYVNTHIRNILLFGSVYSIFRLLSVFGYCYFRLVCYIFFGICILKELYYCCQQLYHKEKLLVGTFDSPGILGGLIAIVMSLFVASVLKNKKWFYLLLTIPFLYILLKTGSRASWLSFLVASVLMVCLSSNHNKFKVFRYISFIMILLILIYLLYILRKETADSRIFMAILILKNIRNIGFFGEGLGNYCGFYGRALYDYFINLSNGNTNNTIFGLSELIDKSICVGIPDCSYNEILRITVENGIIGFVITLILSVLTLHRLYLNRNVLVFGYISLIVFSQFSFPYLYSIYHCIYAVFLAAGASLNQKSETNKYTYKYITIVTSLFIIAHGYCTKQTEKLDLKNNLVLMNEFYKSEMYSKVIDIASNLYINQYCSSSFLMQYGNSLTITEDYSKCKRILMHGIEMSASPSFWKYLGDNSVCIGDYLKAEQQYIHSFIIAPNRIRPLYDLAKLYSITTENDKLKCVIDYAKHFSPKIKNSKYQYMKNEILKMEDYSHDR